MGSTYRMFRLRAEETPPLFPQPGPFLPKVSKPGLARLILKEALGYNRKLLGSAHREALLSRPCIYGVFSGPFGGFSPRVEKCTGCMRCVQEHPEVCSVVRNPAFAEQGDSYWTPTAATGSTPLSTVLYEAHTGKVPVRGMGYKGAFRGEGWDAMWTDMSEIVRPTRDGVYGREYISTSVDIGRRASHLEFDASGDLITSSRTVEIPIPIIFDALPEQVSNADITESIRTAAGNVGTLFVGRYVQKEARCIALAGDLDSVRAAQRCAAIELEDAALLQEARKLFSGPLGVRLPTKEGFVERAVELSRTADFLHLCADYHGRTFESTERHLKDALLDVHQRLVQEGIRNEVTLIASGGIILAEHIPKALLCGADAVALDTALLVALQARFLGECRFPEGSAIQRHRIPVEWGTRRILNLMTSWHHQLIEMMSAMGVREARRLRGNVGRALFADELEREAFGDIQGY